MSDPYSETLAAVWGDPTEYDMQKHGPPYLPPVTAAQRQEARKFAQKRAAYYDVERPSVDKYAPLSFLLAFMRALYLIHQTAHWQTRGGHYYADHTLFQRIYEESLEGIDSIAERSIGLGGPQHVALGSQIEAIEAIIGMISKGEAVPDVESLVRRSLDAESLFLEALTAAKESVQKSGGMTEGLDDLLQGTASKHEEFVYLLGQRSAAGTAAEYTYDRR